MIRCSCKRAGLSLGIERCFLCEVDEANGVTAAAPTIPAPARTPADDAAVYLRAFDALSAARAHERRALAQLTEESMALVARALNARDSQGDQR